MALPTNRISFIEDCYALYEQKMFRVALSVLHDESLAEYAVQDAFLQLIKHKVFFPKADSDDCKRFIITVIKNASINIYNKRKNENKIVSFTENLEEVIIHELMHLKMYPLDQVTESLIVNCFEEGSTASSFAYQQFFTALEQTVEELAKCFLLEFGDNREFSYGRCSRVKSFNDLYDGLKNID